MLFLLLIGMANIYDLIIIGASFEGLCLASYYALSGKKVAIIESAPIKKIGNEAKSMILWDKDINTLKDFFGVRIPSKFIETDLNHWIYHSA
jgi:thioredoxin reductase